MPHKINLKQIQDTLYNLSKEYNCEEFIKIKEPTELEKVLEKLYYKEKIKKYILK